MFQWFLRVFQRNHITVSSDMADIHFAFGAKLLPAEVTLNIFEDQIQVHLRTFESKVGSTCISYQTFQWILSVYM